MMEKESDLTVVEKPNKKHAAYSFSSEDLRSPVKKAKKSEETSDEKQEVSGGGEAVAAVANRETEEDKPCSCVNEEKKEFLVEADVAEDKGARHTMEDVWVVSPDASLDFPGKLRCAHFAIYDGHGGRLAAEFAKTHLHLNVLSAGLPPGCQSC